MKETDTAAVSNSLDRVFTEDKTFSGSVHIAQSGLVLLQKGYGKADKAKNIKNSASTKFLIGSVTKQFTGMSVMQLYANNLLDIDGKLSDYLPDFPRGEEIKLAHLISHTSGIVDYANEIPKELAAMPIGQVTIENIIRLIKDKPLNFDPGTQFRYSNTGYLILGYIIEKVSGISYQEYLQKNIFDPLNIRNTGVFNIDSPPENMATGYSDDSQPVKYTDENNDKNCLNRVFTQASFGAGCLYSTVEDLYRWNQAMKTEKLLPKKYMDMIFAPCQTESLTAPYGFGWSIINDIDFGKIYCHSGGIPGFHAGNFLYADKDVMVILLTNTDQIAPNYINAVMQILNIK